MGSGLCFCIAEKMFCVTSMEAECKFSLKVGAEEFGELCHVKDLSRSIHGKE